MSAQYNKSQFNRVQFNQVPAITAGLPLFTSSLFIDWNNDGDFLDVLEDMGANVLILEGVTASIGKDQLRAESPPKIGDFKCVLINDLGTFSIENTGSPIAALMVPGVKLQWQIFIGSTSPVAIYTGHIEDYLQNPEYGDWTVELPASDALSRLRDRVVSTTLLENVRTDQAIAAILDAAGWPAGERILAQGGITLAYYWAAEVDAFTAIQEIVNTEGAAARWGVDGSGNLVFEDRRYRLTQSRSTKSQGAFRTETGIATNVSEFKYHKLFKDIINKCVFTTKTRTVQAESIIWSIEGPITFAANETRVFRVTASDPFKDAVTPSPTAGVNEVQTISVTGSPTGGGINLSFEGETTPGQQGPKGTTPAIALGATAATIDTALEALPSIGSGGVSVSGGPLGTSNVTVTFTGSLATKDVATLSVSNNFTGGTNPTVEVTETTKGRRHDYKVSAGAVSSVSLNRTSGGIALLTVTAGAGGLTLDWLQVRAKLVTVTKEMDITNNVDASASIAKHGEQQPRGPFRAEVSEANALKIANAYVTWFKDPRATAEFTLHSIDHATLLHQINRLVSDRITIKDAHTSVERDFWIESKRYELTSYEQFVVRFGLEAVPIGVDIV